MKLNTVIFDLDGLLIDSEPLWKEAADETFMMYQFVLSKEDYAKTTGLRTKEFVEHWLRANKIPLEEEPSVSKIIINKVVEKVSAKGMPKPGVTHIFNYFIDRAFKIGLASSSPMELIEVAIKRLNVGPHLNVITSGSELEYGKPHPEVYLNCARSLDSAPLQCICFEDSFNGVLAAKAAKMKCVVIPSVHDYKDLRFHAADLKISSLQNFNDLIMQTI
jgi:sugar-phosphatase